MFQFRQLFSKFLSLAVLGAVLLTVLTLLGRFHWLLELLTHFRLPYLFGYLVLITCLLIRKNRHQAVLVTLALLPHLHAIAPHYWPGAKDNREAHGAKLTLMAFNVLSSNKNYQEVRELIRREDPDLLFLQEIDGVWLRELVGLAERYPHSIPQVRADNFGFLLLSKFPLQNYQIHHDKQIGSPFIIAEVAWPEKSGRTFTFAGAHPLTPLSKRGADGRNETLRRLRALTDAHKPLILAGDLNCSAFSPHFGPVSKDLRQGAAGHGYSATWRRCHPLFGIPIDHILASEHWVIQNYRIGPKCGSDHSPLMATMQQIN